MGRASGRASGQISGVGVSLKKKPPSSVVLVERKKKSRQFPLALPSPWLVTVHVTEILLPATPVAGGVSAVGVRSALVMVIAAANVWLPSLDSGTELSASVRMIRK